MDNPTSETTENEPTITLETDNVIQGQFTQELVGENIQFDSSFAVNANALGDLNLNNSFAVIARSEGNLQVQDSGAMTLVSGGDAQVTNGGAQIMVVGGNSQVSNGGAQIMVVGGEMIAQQTFVGLVITDHLTLSEDSKVLLDKPQALLFGAAFGAVFAVVTWLLKKRRG